MELSRILFVQNHGFFSYPQSGQLKSKEMDMVSSVKQFRLTGYLWSTTFLHSIFYSPIHRTIIREFHALVTIPQNRPVPLLSFIIIQTQFLGPSSSPRYTIQIRSENKLHDISHRKEL